MAHIWNTATGKIDFSVTLEQIKALGADKVILSTDLGQKTAVYPDEGLLDFATRLYENGFSEGEIRKMTVDNPSVLVG